MKTYRNEAGETLPPIYTRHVKGGGLDIYQLIFFAHVLTISKNASWSNGDVHGWKLSAKRRNRTNL